MDPVTPRSRRAVLAGAVGGVAAAAASSLIRPSSVGATDHSALVVGESNTATLNTALTNTTANGNVLTATATGTGTALLGTGNAGRGVTGITQTGVAVRAAAFGSGSGAQASSTTGTGLLATSTSGTGVQTSSTSGIALRASSGAQAADISSSSASAPSLVSKATGGTIGLVGLGGNFAPAAYPDGVGVLGDNPDVAGVGVWGRSMGGTALLGESDSGYGLEGYGSVGVYGSGGFAGLMGDVDHAAAVVAWTGVAVAPPGIPADVGVWAGAENGRTALQTQGVVKMNRSGKITIAVGTSSKKVTVPGGITATSLGFANIQANRSGFYIRGVGMGTADSSITIYLNASVTTSAITVAWVVIG